MFKCHNIEIHDPSGKVIAQSKHKQSGGKGVVTLEFGESDLPYHSSHGIDIADKIVIRLQPL